MNDNIPKNVKIKKRGFIQLLPNHPWCRVQRSSGYRGATLFPSVPLGGSPHRRGLIGKLKTHIREGVGGADLSPTGEGAWTAHPTPLVPFLKRGLVFFPRVFPRRILLSIFSLEASRLQCSQSSAFVISVKKISENRFCS